MLEELLGGEIAPKYARVIKKLRSKKRHTQKELAQLSGISESALRSYELSARKPKPEAQERIVMALRVRLEYPSSPEFDPYNGVLLRNPRERENPWLHRDQDQRPASNCCQTWQLFTLCPAL